MPDIIAWPPFLAPETVTAKPVPFNRSGGRSIGGIERVTKTDRGYWSIDYGNVLVHTAERRRLWNAIRSSLGGRQGLIAVPVWSSGDASNAAGGPYSATRVPHSDDATFSDGSRYAQRTSAVDMVNAAAIGATVVTLRRIAGLDDLTGIRFSYRYAMYEVGRASEIDGDDWTASIFPAIRAPIPAGASLEVDRPQCLVHLAADTGMTLPQQLRRFDKASVSFVEAVDYWNDIAEAA